MSLTTLATRRAIREILIAVPLSAPAAIAAIS
jgi:hypothetical protein